MSLPINKKESHMQSETSNAWWHLLSCHWKKNYVNNVSALWRHWACKDEWSLVLPSVLAREGRKCDETIQEPCGNRGEWTGPSLSGEIHIISSTHSVFIGKELSGRSTSGAGGKSRSKESHSDQNPSLWWAQRQPRQPLQAPAPREKSLHSIGRAVLEGVLSQRITITFAS